jgi:hypothetical protein
MRTRVMNIQFDDEDGSIAIQYAHESEQSPEGFLVRQVVISQHGLSQYEHVAYYAKELREDAEELVSWYEKYKKGVVPGQD